MPDDPNISGVPGGQDRMEQPPTAPRAGPPGDGDTAFRNLVGPARLAFFSTPADPPILADRKASFILGATGLIVTVLLFFLDRIAAAVSGPHPKAALLLLALLGALAALLVIAARSAYVAYVLMLPPMPPTLAFFRQIATRSLDEYVADVTSLTHSQAVDAILHYNYSVAVQAAGKFRLVNRALRCMRIAIPLWMLILLLLAVWR